MSLFETLHPEWQIHLADLRQHILSIETQLAKIDFLPAHHQVFRALSRPVHTTKVLIVGQDPYPNPEFPIGLAFSVNPEVRKIPGSVRNILQEVRADIGETQVQGGDLSPWEKQGVMLLNRVLTVHPGDAGSHSHLGWQIVTDRVAQMLNERKVVVILWGKSAQELLPIFTSARVISGVHPSPLSAHRGFFGSRPFSEVNRILASEKLPEIIW